VGHAGAGPGLDWGPIVGRLVKIIALLPVRNEEWVLRHSLACLCAFCDVVLVSDQASTDRSREICGEFANVEVIASPASFIAEQARARLWGVARQYEGENLIWCTDADELVPPAAARAFFAGREHWQPGTVIDCFYAHLWESPRLYRDVTPPYHPYWKSIAIVDDRRVNYGSDRTLPIHEERVPVREGMPRVRAEGVPVLHLQWLLPTRNQVRQAWYRCREFMAGNRSALAINAHYSSTFHPSAASTSPVPPAWTEGVTFPDFRVDREPAWQEREIVGWFDERGIECFEPLEIWSVPALRAEFIRRVGRDPRPDRSYLPPLRAQAAAFTRRILSAARRRLWP
jgi:hypothetical protein